MRLGSWFVMKKTRAEETPFPVCCAALPHSPVYTIFPDFLDLDEKVRGEGWRHWAAALPLSSDFLPLYASLLFFSEFIPASSFFSAVDH